MARRVYTLQDHLADSRKDPEFKKAWEASELEYQLSRQIIASRLKSKMTQGELAKKAKTTQAVISRIERMTTNVSLELLKRIAQAFGTRLTVSLNNWYYKENKYETTFIRYHAVRGWELTHRKLSRGSAAVYRACQNH